MFDETYCLEAFERLLKADSTTGQYEEVQSLVCAMLDELGCPYTVLHKGGVIADLGGEGDTLAVTAHLDDIGLMVRRVNADGTYTKINKYGAEVYTKPCRVEGTTIVFEADGALLTYYFDGTRLNGADGKVEFVAGSEVAPFDMNSVFGKWYRFGDRSGDSYTLSADGYTFTHEGKTIEGTWSITEGIVTHKDGTVEDDMIFNFNDDVDGNGQREFYSLTENGKVLYDSKYGNAYIHESVLATDEGRELARLFTLVCYTWEGENYDLSFDYYDSTFTLTEYVKEEDGVKEKTAVAGRWSLDGAELMFEFESPELSDEITPFEGDAFYVATYKETFERSRF